MFLNDVCKHLTRFKKQILGTRELNDLFDDILVVNIFCC